jgi:hypothetical protein
VLPSPVARTAYHRLSYVRKREHVLQEHDVVDLPGGRRRRRVARLSMRPTGAARRPTAEMPSCLAKRVTNRSGIEKRRSPNRT